MLVQYIDRESPPRYLGQFSGSHKTSGFIWLIGGRSTDSDTIVKHMGMETNSNVY